MVTSSYPIRDKRTGRARLGIIELGLGLSVIVGLGFVSLRIMNMPATSSQATAAGTGMAKVEPVTATTDAPDIKTP
jgi:hypothetical protein